MLPWFLRDSARLELERQGIESLAATAEWLVAYEWRIVDGLSIDVTVRAHDHDYKLRVSLPPLFPDAPAIVRPLDAEARLSTHQYGGANGPLCLEWGPDNWHPHITAAQMIESAHRLLDIEDPLGQNRPRFPQVAPSRHRLSIGQETRDKWIRWYISDGLKRHLHDKGSPSEGVFRFSLRDLGATWSVFVHEAEQSGDEAWIDSDIPDALPGTQPGSRHSGAWVKTDLHPSMVRQEVSLEELHGILAEYVSPQLLATDGTSPIDGFFDGIAGIMVCDKENGLHLFVVTPGKSIIYCAPVQSEGGLIRRRPSASLNLGEKRIGVVGLGAAGSKIAISLARMGTRDFYVVDHDLLLPENLQRNALDWQGVTQHKADAIKRAVQLIAPGIQVEVSTLHLSGQESTAVLNGVLARLSECDLIVDATADAQAFNYLAAVSRTARRPLVWLEVYGGGVGGFVARSRPGIDPAPQDMRAAYLNYCASNPAPMSLIANVNYSQEFSDGEVLVASDADVSVISAHAARFVPDCFLSAESSAFPH
jgi:sulfur-carrier protein adenylyltransferase/sulfurtransferase